MYLFLCSTFNAGRRQSFEGEEIEQGLEQSNTAPDNIAETLETHRFGIPMFGIPLFRPNLVALNIVRPLHVQRAVHNPYRGAIVMPSPVNRGATMTVFRHI